MFVLLSGGILLAAFILLLEYIKQKREMRKIAKIKTKKQLKKIKRSKSLTVKENSIIEHFKPSTAY